MKKLFLLLSLFAFTANAQYTKLFDFGASNSGLRPSGYLATDGTWLYGTTSYGGTSNYGTIFKIKTDGTNFTKLYDFTGSYSDFNPATGLLLIGDTLYGITFGQGFSSGCSIYKIKTNGSGYSILHSFGSTTPDGARPFGALYYDGSTYLYGTTIQGGAAPNNGNLGTIFKIKLNGTGYAPIYDFIGSGTSGAQSTLVSDGTYLYGGSISANTSLGHASSFFKIMPNGSNFLTMAASTNNLNGTGHTSDIVYDGTYLYGTICSGGASNSGCIFKVMPNGTNLTKLFDFSTSGGYCPIYVEANRLTLSGNEIYGITQNNLYYYNIGSNTFINLYNFQSNGPNNGFFPTAGVLKINNNLYGTTSDGGSYNKGVLYKYDLSTVGLNEQKPLKQIQISPNPNNGSFSINNSNLNFNTQNSIEIYDMFGRLLLTKNNVKADELFNLDVKNGMYLVKYVDGKNTYSQKVVIQN